MKNTSIDEQARDCAEKAVNEFISDIGKIFKRTLVETIAESLDIELDPKIKIKKVKVCHCCGRKIKKHHEC